LRGEGASAGNFHEIILQFVNLFPKLRKKYF